MEGLIVLQPTVVFSPYGLTPPQLPQAQQLLVPAYLESEHFRVGLCPLGSWVSVGLDACYIRKRAERKLGCQVSEMLSV